MPREQDAAQNTARPDNPQGDIQESPNLDELKIPSAYETLMKQHRDAIMRIHTLETENQNLMNLLKQTLSGGALSAVERVAKALGQTRLNPFTHERSSHSMKTTRRDTGDGT